MPLLLQVVGSVALIAWLLLALKQAVEAWNSEHNELEYEEYEDDEYDDARWRASGFKA